MEPGKAPPAHPQRGDLFSSLITKWLFIHRGFLATLHFGGGLAPGAEAHRGGWEAAVPIVRDSPWQALHSHLNELFFGDDS